MWERVHKAGPFEMFGVSAAETSAFTGMPPPHMRGSGGSGAGWTLWRGHEDPERATAPSKQPTPHIHVSCQRMAPLAAGIDDL